MNNNPFIAFSKNNIPYLDSKCSINKMVIAKVPVEGIEDDIEGLNAKTIFSTSTIVNEIRDVAKRDNIDLSNMFDSQLPPYIARQYEDIHGEFHNQALQIVKKFGYRLGVILLTLRTGLPRNRMAREDWTDKEWQFYEKLDTIILVGGLASGVLGSQLKKYALEVFEFAGKKAYELIMFDNASHFGVLGCATRIKEKNSVNVLFDFGQTNVKRSIVIIKDGKVDNEIVLESRPSWFMGDYKDEHMEYMEAIRLHNNIVTIISDTFRIANENYNPGKEIVISIASYTVDGRLNHERGGYAKLTKLASNYKDFLENDLKKILGRDVRITLVHDGTAVAYYFADYKDAVCMSIGTAFGVGFPSMS